MIRSSINEILSKVEFIKSNAYSMPYTVYEYTTHYVKESVSYWGEVDRTPDKRTLYILLEIENERLSEGC